MRWRNTAVYAVTWTLYFFTGISQLTATGVFQLQIRSFRNDLGLTSNGTCCNGYRMNGICSAPCRTYFKVCLAHFQADIATNPHPRCTFANFTTPVLGDNSMNFSVLSDLPVQGSRQNTFYFPVTAFSWPGDFSLIIEAWHDTSLDSRSQEYKSILIARLAEIRSAPSGTLWNVLEHNFNSTVLNYAFRFTCDKNYYGPKCAEHCRARDDSFGHYTCSSNGTKVCMNGWDGQYCETALCLPGCHQDNGYCDLPNECKCRVGWQGKFCTDCVPYPGCHKGRCEKPWDCICDEGWGGLFCNQDLNFCTHHKPCRNGAVCTNTGAGSYTCTCVGSYTGVNCEREVDDCKSKPCVNNGVCKDIGNGFQCQCLQGFYGRQCEKEAVSCKANPCMSGGTCMENEDKYYCLCKPGYTGPNCEIEINECESAPCKNEGRCIDHLNGYRCVCPTGYSGQQCQNNDDDCYRKPCLNNGNCIDLVNDFRCQCVPGFVGTLCQDNVDDCDMRPCANGGRCTDLVNDFSCDCAPGFEGKDCSFQINECKTNPCLNGGICKDLFADYSCSCPEGFWGKNCHLYEGVTIFVENGMERDLSSETTQRPRGTTPVNGDIAGQIASNRDGDNSDDGGLSTTQLLMSVCLGLGIPLILIIVFVIILLCRKRSFLQQRHTRQNLENMAREKENRYINNINNKSGDIFTTLPSSASNSSSIKISNEEQQDINKLNAKHMKLDCDSYASPDSGGGVETPPPKLQTSTSKQFMHNVVVHTQYELPSTSSSAMSPSSPADTISFTKVDGLVSDRDCELEKSYMRLNVDSLSADIRRPLSEYQKHHSQDIQSVVRPKRLDFASSNKGRVNERFPRDNANSPMYVSQIYKTTPSSPAAHTLTPQQQQQQQQQLLQKQFHHHSHYEDDYLATEV